MDKHCGVCCPSVTHHIIACDRIGYECCGRFCPKFAFGRHPFHLLVFLEHFGILLQVLEEYALGHPLGTCVIEIVGRVVRINYVLYESCGLAEAFLVVGRKFTLASVHLCSLIY